MFAANFFHFAHNMCCVLREQEEVQNSGDDVVGKCTSLREKMDKMSLHATSVGPMARRDKMYITIQYYQPDSLKLRTFSPWEEERESFFRPLIKSLLSLAEKREFIANATRWERKRKEGRKERQSSFSLHGSARVPDDCLNQPTRQPSPQKFSAFSSCLYTPPRSPKFLFRKLHPAKGVNQPESQLFDLFEGRQQQKQKRRSVDKRPAEK